MKKILIGCFVLFVSIVATAQKLNFNKDGLFKIAQFTDVYGNSKSDTALLAIERILNAEKPDMVIVSPLK